VRAGRPGAGGWPAQDDACWREAARLRSEHKHWVIIWLASAGQYRAYRRMPGARRDTSLAASTPEDLAAQIAQVEHASPPAPPDGARRPP
jgi:hypothetical protein